MVTVVGKTPPLLEMNPAPGAKPPTVIIQKEIERIELRGKDGEPGRNGTDGCPIDTRTFRCVYSYQPLSGRFSLIDSEYNRTFRATKLMYEGGAVRRLRFTAFVSSKNRGFLGVKAWAREADKDWVRKTLTEGPPDEIVNLLVSHDGAVRVDYVIDAYAREGETTHVQRPEVNI